MHARSGSAAAATGATVNAMKQQSTLFALLSLSLLLVRLLLRLRLAAFRDAALTLHLLARLRIRPVTVRLPGPDGTTLRFWCPASPSSTTTKPPLLLLHGFGGDAKWTWAHNFAALSRSFHLYVPDLVFFGSHSRSSSPLRSVAFQARCVADAMRLLGVPRYHVVGISYGGFVAYRMAAVEARDCVDRLVVMTSAVAATAREISALAAREEMAVEDALLPDTAAGLRRLVCRSMHRPPRLPDFVLHDFIQLMFVDQRKERSELLRELLKNGAGIDPLPVLTQKLFTDYREQLIHVLKGITVGTDKFQVTPLSQEVLIVWGEHDQLFLVEKASVIQRCLDGKARVEIISKTGHCPQIEDPSRFNKILKDFLLSADKPDPVCIKDSSL